MTYNRGTLEEFNTWHSTAKESEGITEAGRIGFVNRKWAPKNQRTIAYSKEIQNPNGSDDYIWAFGDYQDGDSLTEADVKTLGWLAEESP